MNHELDVEALHSAARLALASARLLDAAEPLAERKIGLFDRVLQERSIDLVGKRVNEGRVALKLGEAERRTQRPDQRVHDVGDDVLGMIEFDAGHEMRVAGNVRDHETGRFRFRKHAAHSHSRRCDPAQEQLQLPREKRIGECAISAAAQSGRLRFAQEESPVSLSPHAPRLSFRPHKRCDRTSKSCRAKGSELRQSVHPHDERGDRTQRRH